MKFIFDFDDVLFKNTKQFKEHMYASLEKAGTPRKVVEEYYKEVRTNKFWLRELLTHFSIRESLYEEILNESTNFINKELLDIVKKLGRENCYIVTHGNEEFQRDKIKKSGLDSLFSEIIVVQGDKKEAVEKICEKYKNEKVLFIDDKAKHFEDLDYKKYPNLKTILYDDQGLKRVIKEISS
ncbi:MAG: HAD family hydrolase [Patescibacteria group bacterium]